MFLKYKPCQTGPSSKLNSAVGSEKKLLAQRRIDMWAGPDGQIGLSLGPCHYRFLEGRPPVPASLRISSDLPEFFHFWIFLKFNLQFWITVSKFYRNEPLSPS